jgi:hypothetical protein
MNPGRFAPITCSPRVDSPWKVSRFAPLNRYYIIKDKVFFDYFLEIIYLLVVCKKYNNSFILVYFKYLFISCTYKKKIIHSFWSIFVKDLKWNFSCKIYKNNTQEQSKGWVFFVPTQKCMKWPRCCTSAQITSFLMNYASNAKIV